MSKEALHRPKIAWYGDDFTGATDMLANAAQAGLRTVLFPRVPTEAQRLRLGPLDAVGIAGAARSMSPDEQRRELSAVGEFFASLGASVTHYKCCSTFDSAPSIGSIGAAIRILRHYVPNAFVPIVGGQPNIGRYCLFSQLFAASGTGQEVVRIDRHPTMRLHPVTPMGEADLRLHLQAQDLHAVEGLHYPVYEQAESDQDIALKALLRTRPAAVLMDVSRVEDLKSIGRLIWNSALGQPLLAVGPSGVMQALAAYWNDGCMPSPPVAVAPASGPVFALAGSLSPRTAAQIAAAASYARRELDVLALATDTAYVARQVADVCELLDAGRHVLAFTSRSGMAGLSPAEVARATAGFVAQLVEKRSVTGRPLSRIGIAGGDTSSHAVQALDLWGLTFHAVLAPGVTLCRARSDHAALDGLELMLKGGQMGPEDLFELLAHGLC